MLTIGMVLGLLIGGTIGALCMAAVASTRDPNPSLFPETDIDGLTADELREALRVKSPVVAMADLWPEPSGAIDDVRISPRRAPQMDAPTHAA
jgi:hypothetical protein